MEGSKAVTVEWGCKAEHGRKIGVTWLHERAVKSGSGGLVFRYRRYAYH
jgi:hypothetical protein